MDVSIERACSGSNITWQYIHHGHLPLLDNTEYNIASFPGRALYNYSACPNAAAILHLHDCRNGTCHPKRWDREFKQYKWNNWGGLNDPFIRFQAEETEEENDSTCSGINSLCINTKDSGLEIDHGNETSSHEHNDLKKRDQPMTEEEDDETFEYESEVEKRSHDFNEAYPHPSYPGPSLTNPVLPADSSEGRVLNFGSRQGKPKSSDNQP
ncbi:hypothetical protein K3495_g9957 [Podosphaera aphanis]|nr:hypothetical protein K3495_g9957 [Podosphaera aphanis]